MNELAKNISQDTAKEYYQIDLALFLKEESFFYNIYLKINNNYLKIHSDDYNNAEELKKLQVKGREFIFLDKEGYKKYIDSKRKQLEKLTSKKKPETVAEELSNNIELICDFFVHNGMDENIARYAHSVAQSVEQSIDGTVDINKFLNSFKKTQKEAYLKKYFILMYYNYIVRLGENLVLVQQLDKVNCAILVCDLALSPEENDLSYKLSSELIKTAKYSNILNHADNILQQLPKDGAFGSSICVNLIKNHHEKPNGEGFPYKISYTRFDFYLCLYYIIDTFYDLYKLHDFKPYALDEIIEEINTDVARYRTPNFKKALDFFNKAFKKDEAA